MYSLLLDRFTYGSLPHTLMNEIRMEFLKTKLKLFLFINFRYYRNEGMNKNK